MKDNRLIRHLRSRLAAPSVCLLLLTLTTTNSRAAEPSDWALKDALVFASINDFTQFETQLKKTRFYAMTQDEQARKVTDKLIKAIEDGFDLYAKKLGLDNVEQLKVKPQGNVIFMYYEDLPTPDAADRDTEHMVIAADWGARQPKIQKVLDRITTVSVERGGKKETEQFQGIQLTTVHPVAPEEQPQAEQPEEQNPMMVPGMGGMDPQQLIADGLKKLPLPEAVTFATVDTVTIFGSDAKIVKEVIRRVKGDTADSLTKNEDYLALKRFCAPVGQVSFFVNFPRLKDIFVARDQDSRARQKAFGIDAFRALVMTASLAPAEDTEFEMRGFLPVVGERRGFSKMLTTNMVNRGMEPDAGFPQNTVACGWLNFRFETLIDEIYEIQKRIDPEEAEMMRAGLKVPTMNEQVVDMEAVMKNFTAPLKGYFAASAPYEKDNLPILVTLNHRGRETAAKLFDVIGAYFQKRDLMGQSIYDVAMMPIGVSFSLTDAVLAIGSTLGVEQMIRTGGDTTGANLAADPQFRHTIRHAPKEAWGVIYQDQLKNLDIMLAYHKAAQASETGEEQMPAFSFDVTDMIITGLKQHPITQMDNPEILKKYLCSHLFTAGDTPKGIQLYANATHPLRK